MADGLRADGTSKAVKCANCGFASTYFTLIERAGVLATLTLSKTSRSSTDGSAPSANKTTERRNGRS